MGYVASHQFGALTETELQAYCLVSGARWELINPNNPSMGYGCQGLSEAANRDMCLKSGGVEYVENLGCRCPYNAPDAIDLYGSLYGCNVPGNNWTGVDVPATPPPSGSPPVAPPAAHKMMKMTSAMKVMTKLKPKNVTQNAGSGSSFPWLYVAGGGVAVLGLVAYLALRK